MLIRFEVANFRSILDPVELSMVAIDQDRPAARPAPNLSESVLTVAGIYGPNASGKSNVLAALAWLRDAVRHSLWVWDDTIPIEPFAFARGSDRPTTFAMEILIEGVRFEYAVELDRDAVSYEGLFHYPQKKRRLLFERDGLDLKLQRGLGHLSGTRELLTARSLVLSIARRFADPHLDAFSDGLRNTNILGLQPAQNRGEDQSHRTTLWFEPPPDFGQATDLDIPSLLEPVRRRALTLLQLADLGIDDVVIEEAPTGKRQVKLVHRSGGEQRLLGLAAQSAGTRAWFQVIGPLLTALRSGSLLLFDELDASLHPTLSAQLVRLFQDPQINPRGAQLIFTSHDTSLLNHLNRDEVWLTEKIDGVTRLGALAEFAGERVRRSQNLEKAYLAGRFGALPDVDRTELLRALGLIG